MTEFPIPAVRAIIVDTQGRVLLLRRGVAKYGQGMWCLPGGKIKFGQTAEEAIIQEIIEETSLRCLSQEFLFFQNNLPDELLDTHYITLYFECIVDGDILLNEESDKFAWVGQDNIKNYDIAFKNDLAIQKFWQMN